MRKSGFTPPFGDVGRGLVYLAPLCRGDTPCYTVSLSHAGTPPPLLPALHVPHRDRCCDAPPEPRNRAMTRLPPRSGPATTPPLPGCGRPVAPAGMGHALACLAGPAESGGSGDRDAPGQTSGASASSDPTLTAPGTSERRGEEQLCGISRSYWFWLSIHPLKCLDTWKSEIGLTDQI